MNTHEVLEQIDGALDDWEVGPDAMRCNAPAEVAAARRSTVSHGSGFATVVLSVDVTGFVAAAARAAASLSRTMAAIQESGGMAALKALAAELANPADVHHPPPLCIDGHAYRRRVRNRRRRR